MRTHIFSKLSDDGDPKAPNNLLKSGAKKKHQLILGGPSNRQEAHGFVHNVYINPKPYGTQ